MFNFPKNSQNVRNNPNAITVGWINGNVVYSYNGILYSDFLNTKLLLLVVTWILYYIRQKKKPLYYCIIPFILNTEG